MIEANTGKAGAPSEPSRRVRGLMVDIGYCELLLRELESRRLDLRAELAAREICARERAAPAAVTCSAQLAAFLQVVEEAAGELALGLHAGTRVELQELGLVGLLLRASPDGWSAHAHYERFRDLLPYAADLEVSIQDSVIVSRRPASGAPRSRILSDCFLARAMTCVRQLFGPVEVLEVRLMQTRPPDVRAHARILGERLRFEQAEDALVFPAQLLSQPLPHRDPTAAEVLARHVARGSREATARSGELIGRVLRAMRAELAGGRATTRSIAGRLNLSERTMRRQLSERGTGFQKLLDEVRRDQALRLLHASKCASSELAVRLGFKGEAAFCRAFRRWTGSSVSEYRARQSAARALSEPREAPARELSI